MKLIDLTHEINGPDATEPAVSRRDLVIGSGTEAYTGVIYDFAHDSMVGTYIDFPGHIKETDNGVDAANFPLSDLFFLP